MRTKVIASILLLISSFLFLWSITLLDNQDDYEPHTISDIESTTTEEEENLSRYFTDESKNFDENNDDSGVQNCGTLDLDSSTVVDEVCFSEALQ